MIEHIPPEIVEAWPEQDQRAYYEAVLAETREQTRPLWFDRPDLWVRDQAAVGLTTYQAEFLRGLSEHVRGTMRGPRGLGKTFLSALIVLWFYKTREAAQVDWKIATTSGSWGQLKHYLWPEIRKVNRLLSVPLTASQLLDLSAKGDYGNAFAASPQQPELIEGLHADEVLVLFDEAKIIDPDLFDSIEGAALNAETQRTWMVAVSTPGAPAGRFYDIHQRAPGFESWFVLAVTLAETIAAGRATQAEVDRLAAMWGRSSALYRTHVLGEFAADDEGSMIPLSWVEAAVARWRKWDSDGRPAQGGPIRSGFDIARHGRDKTVLLTLDGPVLIDMWEEAFTDNIVTLADQVLPKLAGHARCTVDADGLGAGTADRLRTLKGDDQICVFNGGRKPGEWTDASGELQANSVRSAAWWNLREQLNPALGATLAIPPHDLLISDIVAPRQVTNQAGLIKLEAKEVTKKRLGRSPDYADALVMALWEPLGSGLGEEYAVLSNQRASLTGPVGTVAGGLIFPGSSVGAMPPPGSMGV